ncbi:MAG: hypothetical protein Q8N79_05270 [Candidatus Methanoperedens sp.]|nr:hypothetical protein [Candidatus Methanoperedens sp.]
MFQGFFEIKTAQDLLGKLKREYTQLQKSPLDQDIAFNFFITAEHISDWLYPGDANNSNRKSLRDSSIYLQVCSHIANGSKHFKAEAKHHKSVSGTSLEKGIFDADIFDNDIFDVAHLVIYLNGDAAKQLGPSIGAVELARRILEFWENHMNPTAHP